jgi:WD40 repeat protein
MMLRWVRAVRVTVGVMAAASGLAVAAGHVGLTSDDGLRIVFRSWAGGSGEIYVMKPDGTQLVKIFTIPSYFIDCSRYDNRIMIAETDMTGARISHVSSIQADGTHYTNLFNDGRYFASFSPNGSYIAIDTQDGFSPVNYPHRLIVASTADGSVVYRSEMMSALFLQPVWSPDSRQIAFSASRAQSIDQTEIGVLDLESGEIRFITETAALETSPEWSPDGTQIAFTRIEEGSDNIYTMNAESGEAVRLTDDGNSFLPAWSPDGTQIAFSYFDAQDLAVFVMEADGSNRRMVADMPSSNDMVACWLYIQNFPEGE